MAILNKFLRVFKEIFLIFLSIFFIFFAYPILLLILFPCWIYKQLAIKLARRNPKIGNILEDIDGVFAGQHPYSDPPIVLLSCYSLAKKLDVSTVVKVLKEKVIEPNLYPELRQRIVRKYGYHFWHTIDNFEVENHVHYIKSDKPNMPVTRSEFRDIVMNKLGKLPFDSSMSPWEILIIPNMIDDRDPEVKSVFILRVHHCLMDGYSIANFLKNVAFKPWKMLGGEKPEEKSKITRKYIEYYKFVMLLLQGPYYFLKMFVFTNDHNQFVQNTFKPEFETTYNSESTPAIPDSRLKTVKNAYGVGMSSLITTLYSQATWKSMKRAGIQVPKTIHCLLSFPLPGHPDNLTNHWSLVRIPIMVNESDPAKTLKSVEKEFQGLRNSVKPLVFIYINKLIALAPLWFRIHSTSATPTSLILTNFPGPAEQSDIFGCIAKQISLGGKPSSGIAYICASFSMAGKFWLDTGAPVCNLPNQLDADFVPDSIMNTLECLEAGIAIKTK